MRFEMSTDLQLEASHLLFLENPRSIVAYFKGRTSARVALKKRPDLAGQRGL